MKKFLTKSDIFLFIILVVLGIASTFFVSSSKSTGDKVVITRDGELYGTYSLYEDRTISVDHMMYADLESPESNTQVEGSASSSEVDNLASKSRSKRNDDFNTVIIKSGKVYIDAASCHNQVCVKHAPISQAGESIICLPNKVVVRIEGKGGGYDAISK